MADWITIGELSERTGVATSALRFYEERGLISSERTSGNQRRYRRPMIRRVSVIRAAQRCGLSLEEIAQAMEVLPAERTPGRRDWEKMSQAWRSRLDERIAALELLRDDLSSCIGCGCLSLSRCSLLNPQDVASRFGPGARYLEPSPAR
jgi:MerR family redox-sensitive transcriptional activator SoxR